MGQAVFFQDEIDHVVHVAVDVVVQGQVPVLPRGVPQVDHVYFQARLEKRLHDAPPRLEIEHGFPVHLGINDEKGEIVAHFLRPVVLQPYPVVLVGDLVGGLGDVRLQGAEKDLPGLPHPLGHLDRFNGHPGSEKVHGHAQRAAFATGRFIVFHDHFPSFRLLSIAS